ncbi:MAG: diguanylate cyclase [Pseudobutyrivibrio sp.]|nr:diguanylate cyclase [Pseudobutyrivibrio sp.]
MSNLSGGTNEESNEELIDYSAGDILQMLKELPDACCLFQVLTDPFGTVRDMQFLFVNEKYSSLVGKPSAELVGSTYYSTVSNRDEDWIRLSYQAAFMRQSVINRTYNTQYNKWFEFWAVPVYRKGFCAFIIHDVTAEKRKEETREIITNSNNIIIECAKVLSANDFRKGLRAALKALGTVLKADRVYIVENKRGNVGDIYEWMDSHSGRGLPSHKEFDKYDFFTMWNKQLEGNRVIKVDDATCIQDKNKEVYEKVLSGNISRYCIATLNDKKDIIGYLIVDNYALNLEINLAEVMESVAIFISEELRNYNLACEMSYMGTHDTLTDLGNRTAFNSTIRMLEEMDLSVGVCFVDINGLKSVNDNEGHEAGDRLIKEVANIVGTTFKKKYCYRIGGDEFVAIVPQVDREHFSELVDKLRKKSKKVPMAIGAIWQDNAQTVEEMVNSADKLMYSDKAKFYSEINDRRQ